MEWKSILTNSLNYWERHRIFYNAILLITTLIISWSEIAAEIHKGTPEQIFGLFFVLAVFATFANLLYCVAYPVDWLVQSSEFRETWLRFRWILFLVGTLFAILCVITIYWSPKLLL